LLLFLNDFCCELSCNTSNVVENCLTPLYRPKPILQGWKISACCGRCVFRLRLFRGSSSCSFLSFLSFLIFVFFFGFVFYFEDSEGEWLEFFDGMYDIGEVVECRDTCAIVYLDNCK